MKKLFLLSLMGFLTTTLCLLAVLVPTSRPILFPENKIVENLTATFYLAAFITALLHIRKHKISYAIALLGLMGFLEEISYGKFIFNYHFPKYYGLDLPNLHNLIEIPYFVVKSETTTSSIALLFLSIATLIAIYIIYSNRNQFKHPTAAYFLIFFTLIIGALTLDMGIAYHRFFPYIEELLELNASLTLLFAAHNFKYQMKRSKATGP